MNVFWDFSITSSPPSATPEDVAPPNMANNSEAKEEDMHDEVEPEREDPAFEDQDGDESRDEERVDGTHNRVMDHKRNGGDLSMFTTLTELLFTPFSDGYCKTPFCSDGDYLPPSCPSGGFYTAPEHVRMQPPQDYTCDEYGDICRSGSAASSAVSSQGRRRRQRPLAFAVGHGDEWKDREGRRVVITPSRPYHTPPRRYPRASTCTCSSPISTNSLVSTENVNHSHNDSPHQTKNVICKFCSGLHGLEAPASLSSESSTSNNLPPML